MAYDPNKDYTTAIKEAAAKGDSEAVTRLNSERNEKIAASGGSLDKYAHDVDNYVSSVTIGKDNNGNTTVTKTTTPSGSRSSGNSTADAMNYSADELDANGVPSWLGSSGAYEALTPEAVEAINSGKQLRYNSNNGTYLDDDTYNSIIAAAGSRPVDYRDAALYDAALQKQIADASYNSNKYYKSGNILDDPSISSNDLIKLQNAQAAFADAQARGDAYGMATANRIANEIRAQYGYVSSYANNAINNTLLAAGGQYVEARDKSGAYIDGGVIALNGKAYDPRTGQEVAQGTQVYSADGTRSWVKNDLQYNGTPYINTNPTYPSNPTLESILGLAEGSLDMQSAQTVARSLGYSSLAEIQDMFDEQAATLKVLRQSALDQQTKDEMAALLTASEDMRQEMYANLANEALAGGSEGGHAANIVSLLLGGNQQFSSVMQQYQEETNQIQEQYNADIAAGRIDAYDKYVENMNSAEQFAQARLYNQLMLANIAATIYASDNETRAAMNSSGGSSGSSSNATPTVTYNPDTNKTTVENPAVTYDEMLVDLKNRGIEPKNLTKEYLDTLYSAWNSKTTSPADMTNHLVYAYNASKDSTYSGNVNHNVVKDSKGNTIQEDGHDLKMDDEGRAYYIDSNGKRVYPLAPPSKK